MNPETERAQLVASCQLGDCALLTLKAPYAARNAQPGQFLMLRVPNRPDLTAPRPISVADADQVSGTVSLLIQRRGCGSAVLCSLKHPTKVLLWGPLGRPFGLVERGRALLVAGGVGVAPLLFLAKRLAQRSVAITAIYGARTKTRLHLKTRLERLSDNLIVCTDDGTEGLCGTAVSAMRQQLAQNRFDRVYLCGPPSMVRHALPLIRRAKAAAQVLLEGRMLCGLGVCGCCTIKWQEQLLRLCRDGPVLDVTSASEDD